MNRQETHSQAPGPAGAPADGVRRAWRSSNRVPSAYLLWLALVGCSGCAAIPLWRATPEVRAPDNVVAAALGDSWRGAIPAVAPAAATLEPPEPTNLRPCCAFGTDLRVHIGFVPVPGFALDNMRGLEDVGPHRYDIAPLGSSSSAEPGALADENNGLLYTCRGGFIDLAHVRDCADLTVYLSAKVESLLETGGVIELAEQGGKRRILLEPVDGERIADVGRGQLSVAMAQWLAFQLSVWHEIASWYGFAAISGVPEKMSAFTPEDLYSNMLGIKLAGGIIAFRDSGDESDYNTAMNAWMKVAFRRMHVTTKASAAAAMHGVDGLWWDSTQRVPDWKLVLRRDFETGPSLKPWLVPMAFPPERALAIGCDRAGAPLRLRNPSSFEGVRFDSGATLQVDVDDAVAAGGFPFPRRKSRRITQADFPAIIEAIRRENAVEFGPGHDRPFD